MQKIEPNFPKCFKKNTKPHLFCPGCGHGIVLKELGYSVDELNIAKNTIVGFDIGCSLLAWDFFDLASVQTHHGRTIPVISGYKKAQPSYTGIAYLGDGGAYAIGLQAFVTACHRNDPITVIVINNTLYGMTGGQAAPTSLCGEKTTTTPFGKSCVNSQPFLGPEMLSRVASDNAFISRTSVSNPIALRQTIKKALKNQRDFKAFSFVEVLSMCPTNWKKNARESLSYLEGEMSDNFPLGDIKCQK